VQELQQLDASITEKLNSTKQDIPDYFSYDEDIEEGMETQHFDPIQTSMSEADESDPDLTNSFQRKLCY